MSGEWLGSNKPVSKIALQNDLKLLEERIVTIEKMLPTIQTMGLVFNENGVPDNSVGSDGWTVMDKNTGSVYRKEEGVWVKIGELWWQPQPVDTT